MNKHVFIYCILFINLTNSSLQAMELEKKESILSCIDLLCDQIEIAKNEQIRKLREFKDPIIIKENHDKRTANNWAEWLERGATLKPIHTKTILDHIRINHRWGTFYIQLTNSIGRRKVLKLPSFTCEIETFKRNKKLIKEFNTLFSTNTLHKQIRIQISGKHLQENPENVGLYTAWLDIEPWQNFFFNLMPWYYRNPHVYAATLTVPACIGTWYLAKWYYNKK